MKKLFIILGAFALVFGSCSTNDPVVVDPAVVPPVAAASVLVSKVIKTKNGVSVTTNYTYNDNKMVKYVSSDGKSTVVTYDNDLVTKMEDFDGTVLTETTSYTYNADNNLASCTNIGFGPTSSIGRKYLYVYNTDGTISITFYTGNAVSQTTQTSTGKAFLTNGQITKIEGYVPGNTLSPAYTSIDNYSYDTKLNPFYNVTGFKKLNFQEYNVGYSLNNLLSISSYNGSVISYNFLSTSTYNSLNYPITNNTTQTYYISGVQSSTITSSYQIFY